MAKRPVNNLPRTLAAPAVVTPVWLGQADLKRQLWRQMAVAALLIVAALVTLIVLDYPSSQEEEMAVGPQFTQPVPVRRPSPPVEATPSPAETPPFEPLAAGPQASGAALERWLPPAEPSSPASPPGDVAAAAKAGAPPVEPFATPMPRLLAGLVVQSGIVPDVRQAEAMQAKFAAEGIPASIEVRLQLGPFKTRAEAEVARQKIKGLGVDGLITVGKVSRP